MAAVLQAATVRHLAVVLSFCLACGGSGSPGGAPEPGDPDGGAPDAPDDPTSGDRAIFEQILAGEIDARAGMLAISRSGGFPIATEGGFLFARLDDGGGPYRLAGDHGDWQPEPMEPGPGLYWIERPIAEPDGSRYKLVGAGDVFAADPLARRYGYDEFGEHSLVRASAAHRERWPRIEPEGGQLAARTVRAWVPEGAIERHLYVHDGQNLLAPDAPFGGWKLDESAPAGTLIVGIDNTPDRMSEYTHVADRLGGEPVGGDGDAYADFVAGELVPLVEARYGEPAVRGVMGSSLGGLISFHIALRHPDAFAFVASLSGTFGWGSIGTDGETLIHRMDGAAKLDAVLFLDSGGGPGSGCVDADGDGVADDGDGADNYCVNRQLADQLAASGYEWTTELHHWHEPGAEHNEAAWAARVFRPLEIFAGL